jgi:hypothetical protein
MFVDDVVLFGIGSKSEWETYKKVLDLFCKATGMVLVFRNLSF